jgi:hypothetical protein
MVANEGKSMTKDKALKLALEALEGADEIDCDMRDAINAIKETLAEPEWAELTRGEILSWEMPAVSSVVEFVWFVERKIREKNE